MNISEYLKNNKKDAPIYIKSSIDKPIIISNRRVKLSDNSFIGIEEDERSNGIYFIIERYQNSIDLKNIPLYIDVEREDETNDSYAIFEYETITKDYLVFKWSVGQQATLKKGILKFSIRYELVVNNKIEFLYRTVPINVYIIGGLSLDNPETEELLPSIIETYEQRYYDLQLTFTEEINEKLAEIQELSKGEDGVGIQNIKMIDYQLIITLTNGVVYNLGNVRGEQGPQGQIGPQGVGIQEVKTNNYEMTVILTDGTEQYQGDVRGEAGPQGVGIKEVKTENYNMTVELTDGTIQYQGNVRGDQGPQGQIGPQGVGIQEVKTENYEMTVILTDGTKQYQGNVRGEAGYTPQKGIDYMTPAEIEEQEALLKSYIDQQNGAYLDEVNGEVI